MTALRLAGALTSAAVLTWLLPISAQAADLAPKTVEAFDGYVQRVEARLDSESGNAGDRFLWPLTLAPAERDRRMNAARSGALVIERLPANQDQPTAVPGGLIHHWIGIAFLPGVTIDRAMALLQDYDRHAAIYAPRIARSKLRDRDGDRFTFHLRFETKKVITVVIDSENIAQFTRPSAERAFSRIVSTRMAEIENPGTAAEREKPIGHDGGYLWRLNTYWRFLERDGGTYLQCESVSLTRGIPTGFGWLVGPFVSSLPRESLEFTLDTTRRALTAH
jgi:hypothetical protein